jgi:hypothetical protein
MSKDEVCWLGCSFLFLSEGTIIRFGLGLTESLHLSIGKARFNNDKTTFGRQNGLSFNTAVSRAVFAKTYLEKFAETFFIIHMLLSISSASSAIRRPSGDGTPYVRKYDSGRHSRCATPLNDTKYKLDR